MSEPTITSNGQSVGSTQQADGEDSESGSSLGAGLLGWLRKLTRADSEGALKETLEEIIDEHGDGDTALAPGQREMLGNILSFGELQVDDAMVPRTDIVGIELTTPLPEIIAVFRKERHSRLPVYRETLDDILGFVHIKDIIDFWGDGDGFDLSKILRQVLIIPPSMPVLDLLSRMRANHLHMAVVVDEYGGTDGLVTIEDVVEEIVGNIEDEHDTVEGPTLTDMPDGSIEADGRTEIEDLEQKLGIDLLPDEIDEEVDTLGGLVFTMLGRIPEIGETVMHDCGLVIEVTDADARRIKRLRVRRVTDEVTDRP